MASSPHALKTRKKNCCTAGGLSPLVSTHTSAVVAWLLLTINPINRCSYSRLQHLAQQYSTGHLLITRDRKPGAGWISCLRMVVISITTPEFLSFLYIVGGLFYCSFVYIILYFRHTYNIRISHVCAGCYCTV